MSDDRGEGNPRNKTVFRPSPLQGLKQSGGPAGTASPSRGEPPGWGPASPPPPAYEPTPAPRAPSAASFASTPSRLAEDDVPLPSTPRSVRNRLLAEAGPLLALAAGIRAGRVRMGLPQFHRQASDSIAAFDRAIARDYPEETRQRAKYALCATIDDIAQNLPGLGSDGAEWARRSLVVYFFRENIGGDRFWQLVDEMLRSPGDSKDAIELYHACLAAGFEGRFRVMPDGRSRLQEIMSRLQGALEHVRSLSMLEMSPAWQGEKAPLARVGFWTYVGMAAAAALGFLFVVFLVLRLVLMQTGEAPEEAVAAINPEERLSLSRDGGAQPPAAPSVQAGRLRQFLKPEIDRRLVTVEEDGSTVRVRTTVGQLFESGSDQLEPGRRALFESIGRAIEKEPGPVMVEGHADTDRLASLAFPDNMALSTARAETVAGIIREMLSEPGRVTANGLGDTQAIASNATPEGKSQNRRVEIIVQRRD
ncbi:MAG: type IVB secretion system protein IcmH/DotU [Allosphingosinicella sp.]